MTAKLGTEDLLRVLREEGAEFPYLTITQHPHNPAERGVFTQRSTNETDGKPFTSIIPMGTCVMRIPLHMLITVELAKQESVVCRAMHRVEMSLDGGLDIAAPMHAYIAVFLLEDRRLNPCSRFRAYYDTLPHSLSHLPLFWPESQLNSLMSSSFVSQQVSDRQNRPTLISSRALSHSNELCILCFLSCCCCCCDQVIDRRAALRHDYDVTCKIVAASAARDSDAYNAAECGALVVTDFAEQVTTPYTSFSIIGLLVLTFRYVFTHIFSPLFISYVPQVASFDEYLWARSIVSSRNFALETNSGGNGDGKGSSKKKKKAQKGSGASGSSSGSGVGTESALVPFGDMLNHSPHPHQRHTRWTFEHTASLATDVTDSDTPTTDSKACKGWFTLTVATESGLRVPGDCPTTGCAQTQGQQEVFDSYGHKSNGRYLLNYGFAIHPNIININNTSKSSSNDITSTDTAPDNNNHLILRCFEDCRLFFQLDPLDPHLTLKVDPLTLPVTINTSL